MGPLNGPQPLESLGARNRRLVDLRRLVGHRRERQSRGLFVLDGERLIADALGAGIELVEVFHDEEATREASMRRLLSEAQADGVAVTPVVAGVLQRIVDPVSPRPIAAVAVMPPEAELAAAASGGDVLVLDGVGDPGNLGTLIRTAEAAGCAMVCVCGAATDPFSPKAVRASAGSILRVPVSMSASPEECLAQLHAAGFTVIGTKADAPSFADQVWPEHVALVLGSESHGVSESAGSAVDDWVSIPMAPQVESLNVAVAGSVLVFALAQSRRTGSGPGGTAR